MGNEGTAREKKRRGTFTSLSFSASLPGDVRGALAESICAVKYSSDPLADFRESILEVIRDGGVKDWEEMEELVYCYVVLNSSDVRCFIADAFLSRRLRRRDPHVSSSVLRADESFRHRQRSMKKNIEKLFFTCTRWQVEETIDLINCPYHYFCDSAYRGDYPPTVDLLVLLFAVSSFFSATAFTLREFSLRRSRTEPCIGSFKRRHLLPSGPIALPLVVLIFANGQRINTIFPLSRFGPALLQLVYFSALAFRNRAETDIKYGVLEASTVSGILHASLRLDSIILPYYTGLEALTESYFSGVCTSCVCRRDALAAGGSSAAYRGWSKTTVLIATALCSRMACRIVGEQKPALLIRLTLEGVSWLLIAKDSFGLMLVVVPQGSLPTTVVYAGLCALILLNFLRMGFNLSVSVAEKHHKKEIIV
ncbi:hypothetical protein B296_00015993 [Ensete ventricosum]|uniref:OVATE domain-containing protein n=1 Tax=Ensete ventricosum TaxID=4639 RepID=A0A427B3J0_ENSVE|nr:hypothetical protein B296_00015993 [Ensete ventricosum]